jgi:hypothetical protein
MSRILTWLYVTAAVGQRHKTNIQSSTMRYLSTLRATREIFITFRTFDPLKTKRICFI